MTFFYEKARNILFLQTINKQTYLYKYLWRSLRWEIMQSSALHDSEPIMYYQSRWGVKLPSYELLWIQVQHWVLIYKSELIFVMAILKRGVNHQHDSTVAKMVDFRSCIPMADITVILFFFEITKITEIIKTPEIKNVPECQYKMLNVVVSHFTFFWWNKLVFIFRWWR